MEQRTVHSVLVTKFEIILKCAPHFPGLSWFLVCLFQVLCHWVWGSSRMSCPPESFCLNPWLFLLVISFLSPGLATPWPHTVLSTPGAFSSPLPFSVTKWLLSPITRGPALTLQVHRLLEVICLLAYGLCGLPTFQPPLSLLQKLPLSSKLDWNNLSELFVPTLPPVFRELILEPLSPLRTHTLDRMGLDVRM